MPYCNSGTCDADFLIQFISLYQKNESLWRMKSKAYYDRARKKREYHELVTLMRTVDPECTAEDVKKKVNSLRSSFRKELKKVQESLVAGDEEPYMPKLWYFNHLLFLKETELQDATTAARAAAEDDFDGAERRYLENDDDPLDWEGSSSSHPEPTSSDTRTRSQFDYTRTPSDHARTELENRKRSHEPDDCDIISKHIAVKLSRLSREQKIHAEKLINDVLYEGQLNKLSRKARVLVEEDREDAEVIKNEGL